MKRKIDYITRYSMPEQEWISSSEFSLKSLQRLFAQRTDGLNAGPEDLVSEFNLILNATTEKSLHDPNVRASVISIYRVAVNSARSRAHEFIDQVNKDSRKNKTVILIALNWNYKILREAIALKKKGYKCYAIVMAPPNDKATALFEKEFDLVMNDCRNWLVFTALIRQLNPTIFHVHCNMWFNFLGVLVIDNKKQSSICIAEFDDMLSSYMDRKWISEYEAIIERDTILTDYVMEGYIFRNADKIIQQFHPNIFKDLASIHGKIAEGIMHQPYPLQAHKRVHVSRPNDRPFRIVWAGQVWDFNNNTKYLIPSSGLYNSFKELLKNDFSCHLFLDPAKFSAPHPEWFKKYQSLEKYGCFQITPGPTTDKLPEALSDCHFGIIYFHQDMDNFLVRDVKLVNQLQNKLFSYIEAGLPVIVSEKFEFLSHLIHKYKIGISAPSKDINTLVKRIRDADYIQLTENVRCFRNKFHAEKMINDVIKVYDHAKTNLPPATDFTYYDFIS